MRFRSRRLSRTARSWSRCMSRSGREDTMIPGEIITKGGDITLKAARKAMTVTVNKTGDRPVKVGSHYHFFETNPALKFERKKTRGMRLDIPAGSAGRVETGQTRDACLVRVAGKRMIYGFRQAIMGKL